MWPYDEIYYTTDESKLAQPGEVIKLRDTDGTIRLCQVTSFKRHEDIGDYKFTLVLLPSGIIFSMVASAEYWRLVARATELEALASADDV